MIHSKSQHSQSYLSDIFVTIAEHALQWNLSVIYPLAGITCSLVSQSIFNRGVDSLYFRSPESVWSELITTPGSSSFSRLAKWSHIPPSSSCLMVWSGVKSANCSQSDTRVCTIQCQLTEKPNCTTPHMSLMAITDHGDKGIHNNLRWDLENCNPLATISYDLQHALQVWLHSPCITFNNPIWSSTPPVGIRWTRQGTLSGTCLRASQPSAATL